MPIDRRDTDERNARVELMMEQYSAAERRRMVKRSIAVWKRADALLQAGRYGEPLRRPKIH